MSLSPEPLLLVYCVFIILASVTGGQMSKLFRMTHLRTQLLMSGVGGLMLGIAMLHLLPHASNVLGSPSKTGAAALAGLIAMFLLVRLFHTHDHGVVGEPDPDHSHHGCGHDHAHNHGHDHGTAHEQSHERAHDADSKPLERAPALKKGFSWAGMFFGLALHTIIDGVALASSVIADAHHGAWLGLAGLGTFLAVALHKPLDAFAITSVMSKQGWSDRSQSIANGLFSVACPLGALMMYFGATRFAESNEILGWGLAISAGFFICIALADLLPEVAFHDHDRGKLTFALLFGVAIAVGIESLPGHVHADHEGHGHEYPGIIQNDELRSESEVDPVALSSEPAEEIDSAKTP
ncbi:ZIP family metal transporter [Neorhodopirellula lusitana]|uniref:ZIP family metal transporter n=1 Tax=Neorhodopirellula lusitana TaxID=445327 RepID=UPI00384EB58E